MAPTAEAYRTLGVDPAASDEALHTAYRRLVKAAHPDRNGGTAEATRRFVRIQTAYDQVTAERRKGTRPASAARPASGPRPASAPRPRAGDPAVEARLRDLEREVRQAREAKERAAQAARDALREVQGAEEEIRLPADDEDSFTKILSDAASELRGRVDDARDHPAVRRATEMLAGLEWLASTAEDRRRDGEPSRGDARDGGRPRDDGRPA